MDWTKEFLATNNAPRRLIAGVITIEYLQTVIVKPVFHPESTIETLKAFDRKGYLTLTNDTSSYQEAEKEELSVKQVRTENNEHTVFDGAKSSPIEVNQLDTSGGAIKVTSLNTPEPKKEQPQLGKAEARAMLNQHWKKFESDVKKLEDKRVLNLLEIVAIEESVADKKKQIIEDRLSDLL